MWIVGVVERRRSGSEKLESSSFYTRPLSEDSGASSTSLAVIKVTIPFGMFTSRYLKVYFKKKSIASLPLDFGILSRVLDIFPSNSF